MSKTKKSSLPGGLKQLKSLAGKYPMQVDVVLMPPEFAKVLWENHVQNYRLFDKNTGTKFMYAMLANEWQFNISDNIVLVHDRGRFRILNGQHRIYAIWKSGKAQEVMVVIVTPKMERTYDIDKGDTGKSRTVGDVAHNKNLDGNALRIVKTLIEQEIFGSVSKGLRALNHVWLFEKVLAQNLEEVGRACAVTQGKKRTGVNNIFRVALTRAYYTQDPERVDEFARQVIDRNYPLAKTADSAAYWINEYITYVKENRLSFTGSTMGSLYYKRLEWAIKQFCERHTVKNLQNLKKAEDIEIGSLLPIDLRSKAELEEARGFLKL